MSIVLREFARLRAPLFAMLAALTLAGCGINVIPTEEERAKATVKAA